MPSQFHCISFSSLCATGGSSETLLSVCSFSVGGAWGLCMWGTATCRYPSAPATHPVWDPSTSHDTACDIWCILRVCWPCGALPCTVGTSHSLPMVRNLHLPLWLRSSRFFFWSCTLPAHPGAQPSRSSSTLLMWLCITPPTHHTPSSSSKCGPAHHTSTALHFHSTARPPIRVW